MTTDSAVNQTIDRLPTEIWEKIIFGLYDKPYQLTRIAGVCKRFREIVANNPHWRVWSRKKGFRFLENSNYEKLISELQKCSCKECFIKVYPANAYGDHVACAVDGLRVWQCKKCYLQLQQERKVFIESYVRNHYPSAGVVDNIKDQIYSGCMRVAEIQTYVDGTDINVTWATCFEAIKGYFERLKYLDKNIDMITNPSVMTYIVTGDRFIAAWLHKNRLESFHAWKKSITRSSSKGGKKDIPVYSYSTEMDRKYALESELEMFGIKLDPNLHVCRKFLVSGSQTSLYFTVNEIRELTWVMSYSKVDPILRSCKTFLESCSQTLLYPTVKKIRDLTLIKSYSDKIFGNIDSKSTLKKMKRAAVSNYMLEMFIQGDFTLPRFKEMESSVPMPLLWYHLERELLENLVDILRGIHDIFDEKMASVELWTCLDSMIGKGCSQTVKYFLRLEYLPDFVSKLANKDIIAVIATVLSEI